MLNSLNQKKTPTPFPNNYGPGKSRRLSQLMEKESLLPGADIRRTTFSAVYHNSRPVILNQSTTYFLRVPQAATVFHAILAFLGVQTSTHDSQVKPTDLK